MNTNKDLRDRFEDWYWKTYEGASKDYTLARYDYDGTYVHDCVEERWQGYQAAHEAQQVEIEAMRKSAKEAVRLILMNISELDIADPDHERTLVVNYDEVYSIVERRLLDNEPIDQAKELI